MVVDSLIIGIGIFVTMLVGCGCGEFLKQTVKIRLSPRVKQIASSEAGGAKYLGVMERILFFGALWFPNYMLAAGGWLVYKLGAKWYGWQHVVRVPERPMHNDEPRLYDRATLGDSLVSRTLNGTLYNGLSAAVGVGASTILKANCGWIIERVDGCVLLSASILLNGIVVVIIIFSLFPKARKWYWDQLLH